MAFTPHACLPQTAHTHTIILLHGRGSNGPELAEELFSSRTSTDQTLPSRLPNWRWVFPTSRYRRDTKFQTVLPSWFDAYSLTDIDEYRELQVEGLKESVLYVLGLVESEIKRLGGERKRENVFLAGVSQGMAIALWVLLCMSSRSGGDDGMRMEKEKMLGGFLGCCGWLPFAHQIETILMSTRYKDQNPGLLVHKPTTTNIVQTRKFLLDINGQSPSDVSEAEGGIRCKSLLPTPVLLCHGADDPFVDVELGRQALRILTELGMPSAWKEYLGADNEGHWIKEPEGFDDIVQFLENDAGKH